MPGREAPLNQEIRDHGLEHSLSPRGGFVDLDKLAKETSEPLFKVASDTVFHFIDSYEPDNYPSDGTALADVLKSDRPSATAIIEALNNTTTSDAVRILLSEGTKSQQSYIAKRLAIYAEYIRSGITHTDYETGEESVSPADPVDICTGLWRDAVYASMIGTPELAALTIARRHMKYLEDNGGELAYTAHRNMYNLPAVRGYDSHIFPPFILRDSIWDEDGSRYVGVYSETIPCDVGYAFPELAKTYRQVLRRVERDPYLNDSEAEHKAVRELAWLIEKSTEYNDPNRGRESPYRSGFAEQLAWAQLGEQVQRQLRGMRHKIIDIDLHNIGRFIGKSGDNPYDQAWHEVEQVHDAVVAGTIGPARDYLVRHAHEYSVEQVGTQGDNVAPIGHDMVGFEDSFVWQLSNEAIIERFNTEYDRIRHKRDSRMSLAQKAIKLHFVSQAEGVGGVVDWINDAPYGLINRAYTMFSRGVSNDTMLGYATAEYAFPGETMSWELIGACRNIDINTLKQLHHIDSLLNSKDYDFDTVDRILLAKIPSKNSGQDVVDLLDQGYSVPQILQYPWLCYLNTTETIDFPAEDSGDSRRYRWLAEHSYAYLAGGWNKNSLGKIIMTRLEAGIENSVHDASQWLETFQIPEEGYDIKALRELVRRGEVSDVSQIEKVRFYDEALERTLLASILTAPQQLRDRLLLPSKDQKIQNLFFLPENQLIYRALLEVSKSGVLNSELLSDLVLEKNDQFFDDWLINAQGKNTTYRITKEELRYKALQSLESIDQIVVSADESITGIISRLNKYGECRKNYIDDSTSWLTRHMTTPHARLTKVWHDRAMALIDGVNDSARDIEVWQANNALQIYIRELERTGRIPKNLTVKEIFVDYSDWVYELSRVYSSELLVRAISEYKANGTSEALLPPATIDLPTANGTYKAEILAKNDPRGTTIGVDTGCCMTLEGASSSCIKSGYSDVNAGFFALYTPEGRLGAQSYFYINPSREDVLVLDNIEANYGRDTDRIVRLYKDALSQYLVDQFTTNTKWQIRTVQVGTGYGDAVKSAVMQLPSATPIMNRSGVYTDAREQRTLLTLTDAQVEQAKSQHPQRQSSIEQVEPEHHPQIEIYVASVGQAEIIRELEKQIYPRHMRQYRDREMLTEELQKPASSEFSFLVSADADASKDYIGYCVAYLEQSQIEPIREEPVLYVADLAILPDVQGRHIGSVMFEGLLERAQDHHIARIELHARESTSYAALKNSGLINHMIAQYGYRLVDHGEVDEFDDGQDNVEKIYLVSLEKDLD